MTRDNEPAVVLSDRQSGERSVALSTQATSLDSVLHGSVLVLIQFDVCEEIRLDQLQQIFGARTPQHPTLKHQAPGYVRYQRPPVVEPIEPLVLESGERLEGQIKYYDYGVVSVVLELPFSGDWDTLVRLGSRWVWDVDFSAHASHIARQKLERAAPALVKPYREWLSEDYFIFHVREMAGSPSAEELAKRRVPRSPRSCVAKRRSSPKASITKFCSQGFPTIRMILAVIGWNAAFLTIAGRGGNRDSTSGVRQLAASWSFATTTNC